MRLRWLVSLFALIPTLALALTPVVLCPGQNVEPMADGRLLGHLPYAEAGPADLVTIPGDFGVGRPCVMQRDAAAALAQLLAAADLVPAIKGKLRGISCFRSVERQRQIFCSQIGPKKRCADAAERAKSSAPPAYSEHATGYTLDFAIRPLARGCGDVSDCIARTAPGQWLLQHAPAFGFELSFPAGNAQGVTWEPWHWRWVGATAATPGAAAARAIFATARARFPAQPGVAGDPSLPPAWQKAVAATPAATPTPVWPK